MEYSVVLRNNDTGEIREVCGGAEWAESTKFLWTDGNFGCDCNRWLFFFNNPEDGDFPCGDTEFTAICAILENGGIVQLDDKICKMGAHGEF